MATAVIRYTTTIEVTVTVPVDDEEAAEDFASEEGYDIVSKFLDTLGTATGDTRITAVSASLDGVGYSDLTLSP